MMSGDRNITFLEEQFSAIHAQLTPDIDKNIRIRFMSRTEAVTWKIVLLVGTWEKERMWIYYLSPSMGMSIFRAILFYPDRVATKIW